MLFRSRLTYNRYGLFYETGTIQHPTSKENISAPGFEMLLSPPYNDDDGKVTSTAADLEKAKVTASVVDHHRGRKILVFTYKNKSRQRRRQGHRQSLTRLKVENIDLPGRKRPAKAATRAKRAPKQEQKRDQKPEQKQDQEG